MRVAKSAEGTRAAFALRSPNLCVLNSITSREREFDLICRRRSAQGGDINYRICPTGLAALVRKE
jgi:hypothetical protein